MIAALFVQTGGVYFGLPGVDPWDVERDARLYAGPYPVVAHPPCERWGRYWFGGPSAKVRRKLGDDGGCFAWALHCVERWGGVLEHPEGSHAWRHFAIPVPPKDGGWHRTIRGGWTCCVEQAHYGHKARKATWLYWHGETYPPELIWGRGVSVFRIDAGHHTREERLAYKASGAPSRDMERLSKRERAATPVAFRDALLNLARATRREAA